jgi:hypothetical protein
VHQVKLFKNVETETAALEAEVNAWLSKTGARVVNMFGNIAPQTIRHDLPTGGGAILGGGGGRTYAPSDVLIVVLYEEA